jgi:hypothetical protein
MLELYKNLPKNAIEEVDPLWREVLKNCLQPARVWQ